MVEPKGFDYSAHYTMYKHGLFCLFPDYSRSINSGFENGQLPLQAWAQHFGRSLYINPNTPMNTQGWFRVSDDPEARCRVKEPWMIDELALDEEQQP
jgi:hypothetical protein